MEVWYMYINNINFINYNPYINNRSFSNALDVSPIRDKLTLSKNIVNDELLLKQLITNLMPNFQNSVQPSFPASPYSLSNDDLKKLLLYLLYLLNQQGNGYNPYQNYSTNYDFPASSPNWGYPNNRIPQFSNAVSPNSNVATNVSNSQNNNGSASVANTVGNSGNVNFPPDMDPVQREKIERYLARANDALVNPQKYVNPNNGRNGNGEQWDYWCLGFVNNMSERQDPALQKGSAKKAYYQLQREGRVKNDWENMPPGSYVLWDDGQYGHIAIYTGERNENGEPMIITSGWNGWSGLHKVPLSEVERRMGAKADGYAAPQFR